MSSKVAQTRQKIAIIGGGVIGLALGWRLAKAGCQVDIFEKREAGRGASWAAGGMLAAAAEYEPGFESALAFGQWSQRLWPSFVADLEKASGRRIGYRREGTFVLAHSDESLHDIEQMFAQLSALGSDVRWMSADEVFDNEPALSRTIKGGYFCPTDFQVDVRLLLEALRTAFLADGGRLHEGCDIRALDVAHDQAVGVSTEEGPHTPADIIVIAGGWESRDIAIEGLGEIPTLPIKGEMAALSLGESSPLKGHVVRMPEVYMVPKAGGRLVLGATSHPGLSDRENTQEGIASLVQAAVEAVPALEGASPNETWAGVRPGTPDGLPLLGASALPNVILATGHYRNGILWTPATVDVISNLIIHGQSSDFIREFSIKRFSNQAKISTFAEAG